AGGHIIPAGTTVVTSPLLNNPAPKGNRTLENGTQSFLLVYSPTATITGDEFDFDWNNDGTLDLPAGVQVVDAFGVSAGATGHFIYPTAAQGPGGVPAPTLALPAVTPVSGSRAGTTVTIDTGGPAHGFVTGEQVIVSGFAGAQAVMNGTFTITATPTPST